ncbi:hypothetical protein [Rhodanobacter denitrificans]|nr:hypothetical protein [Rhodanobacter denitrificans]UJJ53087.1 hypothetical protein LRK52_18450 [Rhodanobacter denitrificans]
MIEIFNPPPVLLDVAPEVTGIVCTAEPAEPVSLADLALDVASGGLVPLDVPIFVAAPAPGAASEQAALEDVVSLLGCPPRWDALRTVAAMALAHARANRASPEEGEAPIRPVSSPTAAPPSFEEMLAVMEAAEEAMLHRGHS